MSELGRLLSEARTARELSLADVEAATRIRQKYVAALESGAFDELPQGAVARGFLRIYARFLAVDVEQALALYAQESGDRGAEMQIAEPGSPRYVDYRPLEVELTEPRSAGRWWRWLAALLIVGALAGGVWWLLNARAGAGYAPVAFLAPQPTPTVTETATPWVVTATPQPVAAGQETPLATATSDGLALPTSDLLLLPTPTVPPTITPTPRSTATPEVVASIILDAEAVQRAWVRVMVDGALAEEGVLRTGDTRSWTAEESINIRTGNGGGVQLALNGEDLGTMGGIGEVAERTWIVDQGQVTEAATGAAPTPRPTPTASPTPSG
jgi:cytoskeletal protein RodZ